MPTKERGRGAGGCWRVLLLLLLLLLLLPLLLLVDWPQGQVGVVDEGVPCGIIDVGDLCEGEEKGQV